MSAPSRYARSGAPGSSLLLLIRVRIDSGINVRLARRRIGRRALAARAQRQAREATRRRATIVRPARRRLRRLLRLRINLSAMGNLPHAEDRATRASRSTCDGHAAPSQIPFPRGGDGALDLGGRGAAEARAARHRCSTAKHLEHFLGDARLDLLHLRQAAAPRVATGLLLGDAHQRARSRDAPRGTAGRASAPASRRDRSRC